MSTEEQTTYTKKDFMSDQTVRWCPGCGDYSILSQVQTVLAESGIPREKIAVVSGIGCSSRFPYYVASYGFHTIHGRAPAFCTGLKLANPELSVWNITGDGDALSIGGNHLIHVLRRNVDILILLFNNRIYGLTKGQYSPTSEPGKRTKSTPMGSIDSPFEPCSVALGAGALHWSNGGHLRERAASRPESRSRTQGRIIPGNLPKLQYFQRWRVCWDYRPKNPRSSGHLCGTRQAIVVWRQVRTRRGPGSTPKPWPSNRWKFPITLRLTTPSCMTKPIKDWPC